MKPWLPSPSMARIVGMKMLNVILGEGVII
jgi:hypothetical protein